MIARSSMPSGSQQAPAAVDFGARAEPRLRAKRDKNISPTSSGEWSSETHTLVVCSSPLGRGCCAGWLLRWLHASLREYLAHRELAHFLHTGHHVSNLALYGRECILRGGEIDEVDR